MDFTIIGFYEEEGSGCGALEVTRVYMYMRPLHEMTYQTKPIVTVQANVHRDFNTNLNHK